MEQYDIDFIELFSNSMFNEIKDFSDTNEITEWAHVPYMLAIQHLTTGIPLDVLYAKEGYEMTDPTDIALYRTSSKVIDLYLNGELGYDLEA